jgi:hypothetical protein
LKATPESREKLKFEIISEIIEQLDKRKIRFDQSEIDNIVARVQSSIQTPKLDSSEIVKQLLDQVKSTDDEKRVDFYRDEIFSPEVKEAFQKSVLDQIEVPKDGEQGIPGEQGEPGQDAQPLPLTDRDKKEIADLIDVTQLIKDRKQDIIELVKQLKSGKIKLPSHAGIDAKEIIAEFTKILGTSDWKLGLPPDGTAGQHLTKDSGEAGDAIWETQNTDDVEEGSNLYYTEARVNANTNVDANTTHRSSDGKNHSDVVLNNSHRSGSGSDHSDVALNTTHKTSDGKDHSDLVLNNSHRTGNGSDHANVALNDTHRSSDGKDHSDVVLNNSHRSGNGSDHANVALNDTHRGSDGSDHSLIDQDVTSGSSPTFKGTNFSEVPSSSVSIAKGSGTPTVDQLQEYLDNTGSSGFFLGGILSDGGSGTLDVSAGSGFIRTTNDPNAELQSFKWSESLGIAVTDNTTQYVYVDDSGVISLSTDEFLETPDKIQIGVVTKENGAVEHVFSLGVRLQESIGQAGRFIRRVFGLSRDKRKGGLIFGQSGDANRDVSVTSGSIWWGRTEYPISTFNTSGADTFSTYSAGGQEEAAASQWNNLQYDNAGTLTTLSNNKWANLFFFIEPDDHIVMVYGRAQHNSEFAADNEAVPSSSLPSKITETSLLAARFTFQKSSDTATISSAFDQLFANAGVSDHGDMAGLADDDHAQYLLLAGRSPNQTLDLTNPTLLTNMKSGATQIGSGAIANELWKTSSHATLPDNVIMIGV